MFSLFLSPRFIKFCVVGGLGTLTNIVIFFILVDILGFNANIVAVGVFILAALQNYSLNHLWTFKDRMEDQRLHVPGFAKFLTVSILALSVNLVVLNLVIYLFHPPYKVIGQAVGILAGLSINYVGSTFFVFRKKI